MLAEVIVDFLPWPGGSPERARERGTKMLGKVMSDRLHIPETDSPGAIKRALNENGWVDGEVLAAGDLLQGKRSSLVWMLPLVAEIDVLRQRLCRSKSLPRQFVLAVTRDRVVVFKTLVSCDDLDSSVYELWIRPEEFGSWPREAVRLVPDAQSAEPTAGTLELDSLERVPVYWSSDDPSTRELVELLAGYDSAASSSRMPCG
jgi:hypothetical protein